MLSKDRKIELRQVVLSAMQAGGITLYAADLYPGVEAMTDADNAMRVAKEVGLCAENADGTAKVTCAQAKALLNRVLTEEFTVEAPPIVSKITVKNLTDKEKNGYLRELNKIPDSVLKAFAKRGWTFSVDKDTVDWYGRSMGNTCIGITVYGQRTIYVSDSSSAVHEMGHFVECALGFPWQFDALYRSEAQGSTQVLRAYSATNRNEYFADYFAYWLENRDDTEKMAALKKVTPKTYAWFAQLEASGWLS
jgi:hypothetical protein